MDSAQFNLATQYNMEVKTEQLINCETGLKTSHLYISEAQMNEPAELNLYPEYAEPNYPITKTEFFDEDNIKHLLYDVRFNKQDRKRLTNYNKHRQSGSQMLVQYRLGAGCEEHQLGRLFPNDGLGLQSFRSDIRNPLTKKGYWDIDMENAHYCIAERYFDKYDILCPKLVYYIQNREDCLKLVSDNRKKSKTEFLKILYGGDIQLYNDLYDEVEGDIKTEGNKFLNSLKAEVRHLMDKIWETHPQYHKLKTGGGKIPILKKPNPKASLMSLLFQTEERKILMFLDYLLKVKYNRVMGIFIHDGGEVEKLDSGETEFPKEILEDCSKIATAKFKIRIRLTQKPIEYEWSPLNPKLTEYETRKMEFEKRNFFVGSQFVHIQGDNLIEYVKTSDMRVRLRCNNYMVYNAETEKNEKKYFFEEWLDDPNRANYERIDFIPDLELCPPNVFNLFKGFNAEKFRPEKQLSKTEICCLVQPIIKHLDYLTSGYAIWNLRWFAKKIQQPTKKCEIALLWRDSGDLLNEGGGTGKNLFTEFFGNEIIGEDYFYIVGDNRELYGNFNSQFEAKLLVMVEEASGKENHANNDILKAKITSKKQNINRKGIAGYTILDFIDYLFCTNGNNALPVGMGNRRLATFDVNPAMRGNKDYFMFLANHLSKPIVKWAFYQFLKSIPTYDTPIQFQNSIPITPALVDMRIMNAPLYLKWIVDEVKMGSLYNASVRELYIRFKAWVKAHKESSLDTIITETAFGLILNKSKEAGKEESACYHLQNAGEKTKSNGVMKYKWNISSVVAGLKKLHLLTPEFNYFETAIDSDVDTDVEGI
jgi:hypothetical protein